MKAKLTFDLPEEQSMYNACSHGLDWYMVVLKMDNTLRNMIKYEEHDEKTMKLLEDLRDNLHHFMEDNGVSLGDVE